MALAGEQDEMVLTLHAFLGSDRDHLDADLPRPATHPQPEAVRFHRAPGFDRALDGPAQRHRQALPRHPEELQARRTGSRLEVGTGLPAELHDLHVGVDDPPRRRIAAEDESVRLLLDRRGAPGHALVLLGGGRGIARPRGETEAEVSGRPGLAREDLVLLVDGGEEIGRPSDALRWAKLEEARGLEGVGAGWVDPLPQR